MIYGIHVRGSPIDDRETQGSSEVVANLRCECVSRTAAFERDTVKRQCSRLPVIVLALAALGEDLLSP